MIDFGGTPANLGGKGLYCGSICSTVKSSIGKLADFFLVLPMLGCLDVGETTFFVRIFESNFGTTGAFLVLGLKSSGLLELDFL